MRTRHGEGRIKLIKMYWKAIKDKLPLILDSIIKQGTAFIVMGFFLGFFIAESREWKTEYMEYLKTDQRVLIETLKSNTQAMESIMFYLKSKRYEDN